MLPLPSTSIRSKTARSGASSSRRAWKGPGRAWRCTVPLAAEDDEAPRGRLRMRHTVPSRPRRAWTRRCRRSTDVGMPMAPAAAPTVETPTTRAAGPPAPLDA